MSNTVNHVILGDITLELSNAFLKPNIMNNLQLNIGAPKTYWSILKTSFNYSKIPLIPPLLLKNEFVIENLCILFFYNSAINECFPNEW